jgi:caa(3)-type oxidase subunit IV
MTNSNQKLHTIDASIYIKVFIGLAILTGLTILQPMLIHMHYAPTLLVQMLIALTKITLVVMYYMHIKGSSPLYKKLILAVILLLIVLSTFTAIDTYVRYMHHDFFS